MKKQAKQSFKLLSLRTKHMKVKCFFDWFSEDHSDSKDMHWSVLTSFLLKQKYNHGVHSQVPTLVLKDETIFHKINGKMSCFSEDNLEPNLNALS